MHFPLVRKRPSGSHLSSESSVHEERAKPAVIEYALVALLLVAMFWLFFETNC